MGMSNFCVRPSQHHPPLFAGHSQPNNISSIPPVEPVGSGAGWACTSVGRLISHTERRVPELPALSAPTWLARKQAFREGQIWANDGQQARHRTMGEGRAKAARVGGLWEGGGGYGLPRLAGGGHAFLAAAGNEQWDGHWRGWQSIGPFFGKGRFWLGAIGDWYSGERTLRTLQDWAEFWDRSKCWAKICLAQ